MESDVPSVFLKKLTQVHVERLKHHAQMLLMEKMAIQAQTVEPETKEDGVLPIDLYIYGLRIK